VNLDFTPDELAFRDAARAWLAENVPAEPLPSMDTADGSGASPTRGGRWSRGPRGSAAAAPRSSSG
jgi:hypothetical protein